MKEKRSFKNERRGVMTGTLHSFRYDVALQTFVCEDCGMTAVEIENEDIQAVIEHREPIYILAHAVTA